MGGRETTLGGSREAFPSTIGTLLSAARDPKGLGRKAALNRLFLLYWRPVYAFIRRGGQPVEDAKDLTQDFMLDFLERGLLARFDASRGRFRAYLVGALRLHLMEARRTRARKARLGAYAIHPLNLRDLETAQFAADLARYEPDELFDRQLAQEVVARSLRTLQRRLEAAGRATYYKVYEAYEMAPSGGSPSYAEVAKSLGLTADRVRKHLEYARRELDRIVAETVAEYASSPKELGEELARHRACLSR